MNDFFFIRNEITKEGLIKFCKTGLCFLNKLISFYLDLNWNDIGDEGLMTLISIGLNKNLINFYLNLEWNEIGPKTMKLLIFQGIKQLNYLTKCQLIMEKFKFFQRNFIKYLNEIL